LSNATTLDPRPAAVPAGPASPTPTRILDISWGLARTATLVAALDLDVFGAVADGSATAAEVAGARGISERGATSLLAGLVALGLLTQEADGHHGLADDAALFLVPSSPRYLGDLRVLHHELNFKVWPSLSKAVRNGEPPAELFAVDATEMWAKVTPYLDALGTATVRALAPLIADALPAAPRLADVGCGSGGYGRALARTFPDATVVGFDRPGVCAVAAAKAADAGLADRVTYVGADLLDGAWDGPHDLVLLANVLHGYDHADCTRILDAVHRHLAPGGVVVISEIVPPDDPTENPVGAMFGLEMLLTSEGSNHSVADYRRLLAASGFGEPRVQRSPSGPSTLLVAARDSNSPRNAGPTTADRQEV
jgi:2-polyprenyl-3-methyl-5-hydroxy-6-metoxy-1,4-benzoquinol methylase